MNPEVKQFLQQQDRCFVYEYSNAEVENGFPSALIIVNGEAWAGYSMPNEAQRKRSSEFLGTFHRSMSVSDLDFAKYWYEECKKGFDKKQCPWCEEWVGRDESECPFCGEKLGPEKEEWK